MNVSLKKANEHRNAWFEGVQRCALDETLFTVMERIVRAEVHRLVVVDENERVIGIISLSDLLLYLVLRPSGDGIGDSESLRASDPVLAKMSQKNEKLQHNSSNESIKEETPTELEKDGSDNDENAAIDDVNCKEKTDNENEATEEHNATDSPEHHVEEPECNSARSDTPECEQPSAGLNDSFANVQREVALVSE